MIRSCIDTVTKMKCQQLGRCLAEVSHWISANRLELNSEKTQLLWVGSKHSQSSLGWGDSSLQIGSDIIPWSCTRCDLLVRPELGQTCFQRLCNMFLLAPPTSTSSTVTWWRVQEDARSRLRHSPIGLLQHGTRWCTEWSRSVADRLQLVLNAAARLVSGTRKYDWGLAELLHTLPTCTGSMWQIGSDTSSPSQSTDVCTIKRRST